MTSPEFLTDDVKDLMQRLNRSLLGKSPVKDATPDRAKSTEPPVHHLSQSALADSLLHVSQELTPRIKRTLSCERFKNTTLRRMAERAKRTEQNRILYVQQREEKLQEDIRDFKASEKSKEIAGKIDPLHIRTAKIIKERQEKQKEMQAKLEEAREAKLTAELTFHPRIKPSKREHMSAADFYAYNVKWVEDAKKAQTAREELRTQQEKQALTLKPTLTAYSRKLTNSAKYSARTEDRMADFLRNRDRKVEDLRRTLQPSFAPTLCPASKKMAQKRQSADSPRLSFGKD